MLTTEAPRVDARPSPLPRMTREQQDLAAAYVPLAKSLAKPFARTWPGYGHEFVSAALLGLCTAAKAFCPDRGVKFSTYSRRRITGELVTLHHALKAKRPSAPGSGPTLAIGLPPEDETGFRVPGRDSPTPEIYAREALEPYLRLLSGRHREIVTLVYRDGLSQRDVSQLWGLSWSRVSTLHCEALAIIRDHLTRTNEDACAAAEGRPVGRDHPQGDGAGVADRSRQGPGIQPGDGDTGLAL